MVRIPTYDVPTLQPGSGGGYAAPTPVQFQPQDPTRPVREGLAGLAEGVSRLSQQKQAELLVRQERYDEAIVRSRVADYRLGGEALLQDPKGGFLQVRGEAAFGQRRQDIEAELGARRQRVAEGLQDPLQREMFDRAADQFDASFRRVADQHAGRERERFGIASAQANVDSLVLGAPQLYGSDRAAFDLRLGSIRDSIAEAGRLQGKPAEEIAIEQGQAISSVWAAVVDDVSRSQQGPVRAYEMVQELAKSGELMPNAARTLTQQLDAAAEQHTAQNAAIEVWEDTKDIGRARARLLEMRAKKQLPDHLFESAMQYVRRAHADETMAMQSSVNSEFEAAKVWALDKEPNSPDDLEAHSPGSVERLKRGGMWDAYVGWFAEKRHYTRRGAIEELGKLRESGELGKMGFEEFFGKWRSRLSDRDFALYSTYTADAGKRSQSGDSVARDVLPGGEKLAEVRTRLVRQMMFDGLLAAEGKGADLNPKGEAEIKAYDYEQAFMPLYLARVREGMPAKEAWDEVSVLMLKDVNEKGDFNWRAKPSERGLGAMADGVDSDVAVSPGTFTKKEADEALLRLRKDPNTGQLRDPSLFTQTQVLLEVRNMRVEALAKAKGERESTPGWVPWDTVEKALGMKRDDVIAMHGQMGSAVHSSDMAYELSDLTQSVESQFNLMYDGQQDTYVPVRRVGFPGDPWHGMSASSAPADAAGAVGISKAALKRLADERKVRMPSFPEAVRAAELVLQMPLDPRGWSLDRELAKRIDTLVDQERKLVVEYGPDYPRVRELRAQIGVLDSKLLPVNEGDYRAAMTYLQQAKIGFAVEYPGIERRDYSATTADQRNARKTFERLELLEVVVDDALRNKSWTQLDQFRNRAPNYAEPTPHTIVVPTTEEQDEQLRLRERQRRIRARDQEFADAERARRNG